MSTEPDAPLAHRASAGQAALESLTERVARQFPEIPVDVIARTVRGQYEGPPPRPKERAR
jgi:hypothetical protein